MVSIGPIDQDRFAVASNSVSTVWIELGKPPPPYSGSWEMAPHPEATYWSHAVWNSSGTVTTPSVIEHPCSSPMRLVGAITSATKRPNSSNTPSMVSTSTWSKSGRSQTAPMSPISANTRRMSSRGGLKSVMGEGYPRPAPAFWSGHRVQPVRSATVPSTTGPTWASPESPDSQCLRQRRS